MNGNVVGDEEGEFTYTGERGDSVIDYVIRGWGVWKRAIRLK